MQVHPINTAARLVTQICLKGYIGKRVKERAATAGWKEGRGIKIVKLWLKTDIIFLSIVQ